MHEIERKCFYIEFDTVKGFKSTFSSLGSDMELFSYGRVVIWFHMKQRSGCSPQKDEKKTLIWGSTTTSHANILTHKASPSFIHCGFNDLNATYIYAGKEIIAMLFCFSGRLNHWQMLQRSRQGHFHLCSHWQLQNVNRAVERKKRKICHQVCRKRKKEKLDKRKLKHVSKRRRRKSAPPNHSTRPSAK